MSMAGVNPGENVNPQHTRVSPRVSFPKFDRLCHMYVSCTSGDLHSHVTFKVDKGLFGSKVILIQMVKPLCKLLAVREAQKHTSCGLACTPHSCLNYFQDLHCSCRSSAAQSHRPCDGTRVCGCCTRSGLLCYTFGLGYTVNG